MSDEVRLERSTVARKIKRKRVGEGRGGETERLEEKEKYKISIVQREVIYGET